MAAGGEKCCLRRREVVLRNLSERKREGQKLLMADLKRMTEKTIDTGAGNKSDEKADQSENSRACGWREGDEARSRREAGDGEGGKDKVMKKAGKDKVGREDEGDGTTKKVRKKVAGRVGYGGAYIKNPGFSSGVFYFFV